MKVISTLQNTSTLVNGVKFVEHALGMISEEIEQAVADHFLSIPGFKTPEKVKADAKKAAEEAAAAEAVAVADAEAAAAADAPAAKAKTKAS